VWNVDDQCCVQTLTLNFPSFSMLGKVAEFGIRSLYPGPSSGSTPTPSGSGEIVEADMWQRDQLLVACCDSVAVLRVQAARDRATPPPLPPPSREHHASVPPPWTAADARGIITPDLPLSLDQSDSRYLITTYTGFCVSTVDTSSSNFITLCLLSPAATHFQEQSRTL
jgi:hypothetical protein